MNKQVISFVLNGEQRELEIEPNELLMNVLRERENLTGTKYGCGIGECGACAVHVDGQPVLSCIALAIDVDGREVVTVEGLGSFGSLDPLQESFIEEGAVQCGFCTPGMVMMGRALLNENSHPTELEVRHYMRGSLCRCTGYSGIVRAVLTTADKESSDKDAVPAAS